MSCFYCKVVYDIPDMLVEHICGASICLLCIRRNDLDCPICFEKIFQGSDDVICSASNIGIRLGTPPEVHVCNGCARDIRAYSRVFCSNCSRETCIDCFFINYPKCSRCKRIIDSTHRRAMEIHLEDMEQKAKSAQGMKDDLESYKLIVQNMQDGTYTRQLQQQISNLESQNIILKRNAEDAELCHSIQMSSLTDELRRVKNEKKELPRGPTRIVEDDDWGTCEFEEEGDL